MAISIYVHLAKYSLKTFREEFIGVNREDAFLGTIRVLIRLKLETLIFFLW